MKTKVLFIIAGIGILAGIISVIVYNTEIKQQPPLSTNANPYEKGIYATGIVESYQEHGENINIFPEVAGRVTDIFVTDGQTVKKGQKLLTIDDSVQKKIVEKDKAQVNAALALLQELKAEPRKENLDVVKAQLDFAAANLKNVQLQLEKIQKSYGLNAKSISKNTLDNAINAVKIAEQNFKVAKSQYDLVKAGAWSFDIKNQEEQYHALLRAYESDKALLDKYVIKSSIDGVILYVRAAIGGYISPAGSYDTYTQSLRPIFAMGVIEPYMEVKCYLNELLVPKMPIASSLQATMFIRGNNNSGIPLEFIRIQPYTIPNIQLSDEVTERVDVRVLPILFKFKKPEDISIYPGQLVDVYIKEGDHAKT